MTKLSAFEQNALDMTEKICNRLDAENDDQVRADLIDQAINLADFYGGAVANAWRDR